tara:strand:- start:314 stop:538 length:225 start_codon:yes stop_codon:yes gene_type:complete
VLLKRVIKDGYGREKAVRIVSSLRANGGRGVKDNLVGYAIVLGGGVSSSGDQSLNGFTLYPADWLKCSTRPYTT